MDNHMVCLSFERMKVYAKKFWWIICTFLLLGCAIFAFGVNKNAKQIKIASNESVYSEMVLVSVKGNGSTITTSSIIGDCQALLQSEKLKDVISNDEAMNAIELTREDSSNCFSLSLKENTNYESTKILNTVINELSEMMQEYHQGVTLSVIDNGKKEVASEDQPVILLRDFLMAMGVAIIGVIIVYFIMIFDRRIVTSEEVSELLGVASIMEEDESREQLLKWVKYTGKKTFIRMICVNSFDEIHTLFEKSKLDHVKCFDWENFQFEMLNDCENSDMNVLYLKKMNCKSNGLMQIKNEFEIYGIKISGFIFEK